MNSGNINIIIEGLIDINFTLKNKGINRYILKFNYNLFPNINIGSLYIIRLK